MIKETIDKTWLAKTISEGLRESKFAIVHGQLMDDLFKGDANHVLEFCKQNGFVCRENPVTGKFEFRKRTP